MGVPKFFRWLSERYPAISQLIAENRIPEFDCLYLDMNGIIHNCTHKDSDDAMFRMSEEEMFIRIFNYIEHLFGKIKPKQLFFMAVDGVAPRAKMNQQRSRRFRTALDVEMARKKAIQEGKELPTEEPFDSNCITPGTDFMARLSTQLKYFVNKKVSEDKEWQQCKIVLSGHDVPGEGEHKIMEYIRNAKAQKDYHPNMRHCLYGLDADLIMLGLLSHDPHFCLLREEVTFGRQSKTKSKELEHQNFYLMHLCIVREYLELEFQELKAANAMPFPFNMERIIDDFILMAFFVGNDFLPNLPRLHINEGALATMFAIYKRVLPHCEGYINEGGTVNLKRLGLLLEELSKEEFRFFEHEIEGEKWFQAKQMSHAPLGEGLTISSDKKRNGRHHRQHHANGGGGGASTGTSHAPTPTPDAATSLPTTNSKGKLVLSTFQKELWKHTIRKFVSKPTQRPLDLGTDLKAEDRKFVQDLADGLRLDWRTDEDGDGNRHLVLSFPADRLAAAQRTQTHDGHNKDDEDDEDDEREEEAQLALFRVMKKYDTAEVADISAEQNQEALDKLYMLKFQQWKDKYYQEKFYWSDSALPDEVRKLCENYVQGLQWVLYYYYRGIASWPWFYQYHYAPLISDVLKGLGADLNFKLGQPFRPFEQLMGVLPDRSKKIVPAVYWPLMTEETSPIIDFYPRDFELDMNGKKMEWEAVVKIPFIDESRLLAAMAPKNALLTDEEKERNEFGVPIEFTFQPDADFVYPSSLTGIFPEIQHCRCIMNIFELPPTEGLDFLHGLTDGALLNVSALAGFPSLATLPYTATLGFHGVNVFQQESRNASMVVNLSDSEARTKVESAKAKLGRRCHVGYPFLQEAKVVGVSDELFRYTLDEKGGVVQTHHGGKDIERWQSKARSIEEFYSRRLAILTGPVESLVHVHMLKGLVKTDDGSTVKEYGEVPAMETDYAAQVVVDEVVNEDERFIERAAVPIEEEFPVGSHAFYVGDYAYGRPLGVVGHKGNRMDVLVSVLKDKEPDFAHSIVLRADRRNRYQPSYAVAKALDLHPLSLSKITSSFYVFSVGGLKVNLGLNLKFEGKKQKVLGYSRKSATGWEFSNEAIKLIANYMVAFPDFFAGLKHLPQNRDIKDNDIWPDEATASKRVKEIGAWLKAQDTNNLERVPLDAEQLDSDVVSQVAAAADQASLANPATDPKLIGNVPRNAVLKPSDAEQRLGNQLFSLGDRVVYVQDSGKVPIAARGTVVGISRTAATKLLDVVFDTTFMSGTTLGERCPAFRGQMVLASSVLNLTNRQVVAGSRAAIERRPAASLTTLTVGSGYGHGHGHGTGRGAAASGIRQYRDAPAPAPLHGSWRGALNGGNRNGGRGGGSRQQQQQQQQHPQQPGPRPGSHLQHSSLVYRTGGPHQQQQQTQQQGGGGRGGSGVNGGRGGYNNNNNRGRGGSASASAVATTAAKIAVQESAAKSSEQPSYNAVPPPPNLDAGRGRGRGGRGRGRGRGGQQQSNRGNRGAAALQA
ncbi:exonuclease [Niveomyces insectorum RCEF 264]|uniref:5'-3' exoribonuclease 1 n=1 Tax=Niveomyces insectorum RCEF 264 TaxID=1081102 RepID=A0A162JCN3_9HYPO|nr:exonuclease [Niveomyces insectorum RCEF 264]